MEVEWEDSDQGGKADTLQPQEYSQRILPL